MNAEERLKEISAAIVTIQRGTTEETEVCANIEAPDDEDVWMQLLVGVINISWPYEADPAKRVTGLGLESPPGLALRDWEEASFATFMFETVSVPVLAAFIEGLLGKLYGCDLDTLEIKIGFEEL